MQETKMTERRSTTETNQQSGKIIFHKLWEDFASCWKEMEKTLEKDSVDTKCGIMQTMRKT